MVNYMILKYDYLYDNTICTYNMITCIIYNITHILQINNNFFHNIYNIKIYFISYFSFEK